MPAVERDQLRAGMPQSPAPYSSQNSAQAGPVRIGIMGGTFDPIHNGHLVAASEVQSVFGLDEVIFVPTYSQPFKQGNRVTPAEHRYLMTVVATASNPRFTSSRVDIDRGGVTYTVDTLRDIAAQYPGAELYFITGADALAQILSWKDADELFEMAHMVGVTRPGHVLDDSNLPADKISLVEVPALAISSTDCRTRVRQHLPVWYLVPDGVVHYIRKYGLYRSAQRKASSTSMTAHVAVEQTQRKEEHGDK